MRLVRVELSRYFSRRAVTLLLAAAALLTALVAGITIWDTRPVSARDLAAAQAQVDQQVRQPGFERELANCRENPEQYLGPDTDGADCEASLTPRVEDYLGRATLSLGEQREQTGVAVIILLSALMVIVGATYAGADWATGSMSNQLLFEPRRLRVWLAKAVAATLACGAVAAVLLAAFWLSLYLAAESRGIATGAATRQQILWLVARGTVLAGLAGLGGYALSMLLRSTVGTLALLFAYAAGGEALLALVPVDRSGRWSPSNNVFAWIQDGIPVFDESVVCGPQQALCDQNYTVSLAHGAAYLGTLLLAALLVSALLFRRRDVP